jgi:hypothetical protein
MIPSWDPICGKSYPKYGTDIPLMLTPDFSLKSPIAAAMSPIAAQMCRISRSTISTNSLAVFSP